ncbi:hypothetical protein K1W54_04390 [Micromonospora sp. CPCC 205371]|nr:hypothetical protein [Micromonospora sp. CPCC 205371]
MSRQTDTDWIHTSDATPGDVLISLTHGRSSHDENFVRLEVTEQISGVVLVRVNLDAKQFTDIMGSVGTVVSADYLPAHPERIGRRRENTSVSLGTGVDPEPVRAAFEADGWEMVRVDRTNFGHRVIAYRWIANAVSTTETKD